MSCCFACFKTSSWSIDISTITVPGFISLIISFKTTLGASLPTTYTAPTTMSETLKLLRYFFQRTLMYSILLSPSSDFNSDNLFSESSIIFTYAPFECAFFIASVPATPAPITVTTLGLNLKHFLVMFLYHYCVLINYKNLQLC